ncbi:hypothetical protein FOL47_004333 [Perkinsus chesapeaki]|uniref:RRM domain-containing protein n=1 Tax=Perkinsus chesapeaki TaxID=330153 RepID=A0A7J6M313_PERCH|nr:hypothetical protein FOL47_004333 [Perkinsus chesapeaki]
MPPKVRRALGRVIGVVHGDRRTSEAALEVLKVFRPQVVYLEADAKSFRLSAEDYGEWKSKGEVPTFLEASDRLEAIGFQLRDSLPNVRLLPVDRLRVATERRMQWRHLVFPWQLIQVGGFSGKRNPAQMEKKCPSAWLTLYTERERIFAQRAHLDSIRSRWMSARNVVGDDLEVLRGKEKSTGEKIDELPPEPEGPHIPLFPGQMDPLAQAKKMREEAEARRKNLMEKPEEDRREVLDCDVGGPCGVEDLLEDLQKLPDPPLSDSLRIGLVCGEAHTERVKGLLARQMRTSFKGQMKQYEYDLRRPPRVDWVYSYYILLPLLVWIPPYLLVKFFPRKETHEEKALKAPAVWQAKDSPPPEVPTEPSPAEAEQARLLVWKVGQLQGVEDYKASDVPENGNETVEIRQVAEVLPPAVPARPRGQGGVWKSRQVIDDDDDDDDDGRSTRVILSSLKFSVMLLKSPTERNGYGGRGEVDSSSDDSDLVADTADVARKLAMSRTPVAASRVPLPKAPRSPGGPLESTAVDEQIDRPVLLSTCVPPPPKPSAPRSAPPARPPRHRTTGSPMSVVRPARMPSETTVAMDVVLDGEGRDLERNLPQYVELLKSHGVTDGPVKPVNQAPRVSPEPESLGVKPSVRMAEGDKQEYDRDRKAVYGRLPRRPPVQYAGPSMGREIAPLAEPRPSFKSGAGLPRAYNASPLYYERVRQEREGEARGVRKEERSSPRTSQLPAPPPPPSSVARRVEAEPTSSPVAEYEYVPYVKTNEISGFNSAELSPEPSRSWTVQPPRGAGGPWTVQPGREKDGRGGISWDRAAEELEDLPRDSSCRSSHEHAGYDDRLSEVGRDEERYSDAHAEDFEGGKERSYSGGYSRRSDEDSPRYGHTSDEESETDGYSGDSYSSGGGYHRGKGGGSSGRRRAASDSRSSEDGEWSSSENGYSEDEGESSVSSGKRRYSEAVSYREDLAEIRYESSPRPSWESVPKIDPIFIKGTKGGGGRRPVGADKIRTGQADAVLPSFNRNTVKPSEIMGVFKSKPTVEVTSTTSVALEEPPPATPAKSAMDNTGEAKVAWMTGVLWWIAKLDGVWYIRGNAGSSVKHYLKPIDVSTAEKGRFMELQPDGVSRPAGYLILKPPEQRHLNNYFYTDLIELEDLRPALDKGASWQLTEGCFNSDFRTLTFVRSSVESEGGDTHWLVFDRSPRVKGGTPESQLSRKSSEPVDTPEKSRPMMTHHVDERWKAWSGQGWDWENGGKSRRWKDGGTQQQQHWERCEWDACEKGWGGGKKAAAVFDWNSIEYHPDWRRFTGEWYGFKQYGNGKRPTFKSRELPGPHKDDNCIDNATILFVWGIPSGFTEDDLHKAFSQYGEIQEAKVKRSDRLEGSLGFGYGWIRYKERSECEYCISQAHRKLILQGRKYPVEVRLFMERYFFRRYGQMLKEDIPKRSGYWLKVLNNIDYHSSDYGYRFVLRVFNHTVVEFNTKRKEAVLHNGRCSMRVVAFVMNLFLENTADCKVDNYHSPGEVDENYRVYKNFSCRGATNSEKFVSGMHLDLGPCNNADLSSSAALVERMEGYISEKRYNIEKQESGWLA